MKKMAIDSCKRCGAVLNGAQVCPTCGTPKVRPLPVSTTTSPLYIAPYTETLPPKGSRYAVMSIGSYMGSILLFSIPVIGFIFMVVWACGGCINQNRRNFARAYLLWLLIGIAVTTIAATIFSALGLPFIGTLQDWITGRVSV